MIGYMYNDNEIIGSFNCEKNGIMGCSLSEDHGLNSDEIKLVFQTVVDESEKVFNLLNTNNNDNI